MTKPEWTEKSRRILAALLEHTLHLHSAPGTVVLLVHPSHDPGKPGVVPLPGARRLLDNSEHIGNALVCHPEHGVYCL